MAPSRFWKGAAVARRGRICVTLRIRNKHDLLLIPNRGGVMRKSRVLVAIAIACAAGAGTFVARSGATSNDVSDQVPAAHSGPYDYAVGGAERSADAFAARHVALSAHNGPRGATGEFTSQTPTFTFTSDVTCLRVDGNRAVIGAIVRESAERPDLKGLMVFAAF